MAHPHYYRVKAAMLEWTLAQDAVARRLATAQEQMRAELCACDLDPDQDYILVPETHDIAPAKTDADAAPEAPAAAEGQAV